MSSVSQDSDTNELVLLRKLGNAELIYDFEIKHNGCVLPFTFLFSSSVDLFAYKAEIERAIHKWRQKHTFLNSRIVILDPGNPRDEKGYSRERFFALQNPAKMASLENVSYLRLNRKSSPQSKTYWEFLHERELNILPVDSREGPLWRLSIIEIEAKKDYVFILTIHHAIVDGRNAYCIVEQLLALVDQEIANPSPKEEDYLEIYKNLKLNKPQVCDSIETKLFNDNETIINDTKFNPDFELSPDCKIPDEFGRLELIETETTDETPEFIYLFEKQDRPPLSVNNKNNNEFERVTQFTSLSFEADKVNKLLMKCRRANAKLTGCLHVICSLATYDLYSSHNIDLSMYRRIWYHFVVNLRPSLNIDNLEMGYWPVVQNGVFDIDGKILEVDKKDWYDIEFWKLVKLESDSIHRRLREKEHIESAKLDKFLLDLIDQNFKFEQGGGVHFALSNVGSFESAKLKNFKIRGMYYNVSCADNRWSTGIFNGLATIENRLCWSIGSNSRIFHKKFVEDFKCLLTKIFDLAIEE